MRTPSHCFSAVLKPALPSITSRSGAARPRCWRSVTTAPQVTSASDAARRSCSTHFWPFSATPSAARTGTDTTRLARRTFQMEAIEEDHRVSLAREVAILPRGEQRLEARDDPRDRALGEVPFAEQWFQRGADAATIHAAQ